ncbi:ribonuclease inhibitor-like [Labeo rohita]|uniref:ribonuclease inhibitor-like n=1 Tax=Labeo rohita TaxID=84645 RepID=UPI0021E32B2F|nr:ribonuclease inhibitor-like [Labeo rohita]
MKLIKTYLRSSMAQERMSGLAIVSINSQLAKALSYEELIYDFASRKSRSVPLLRRCSIGEEGCAALISALRSNPSHLRELDLSYNKPGDSGVNLISALLEDPHCKLEKLVLWRCSIGEEGCAALISALRSNPSHLRELNLSYNKPGDSGVNLISALLQDPHCKLEKLV